MSEELEDRIKSEYKCHASITNEDLTCKDCRYSYDDTNPEKNFKTEDGVTYAPTTVCEKFDMKPNKVLLGKECDEKVAI